MVLISKKIREAGVCNLTCCAIVNPTFAVKTAVEAVLHNIEMWLQAHNIKGVN